ncbi:MAG: hypothetical protein FWF21_07295 [Micrococcales bacterium]|nr:hypothetical protein [Micrococcales bacterium]
MLRSTGFLFGASVVRNLGPPVVLVLVAQVLRDPTTLGRYSLALAIATPLFSFAQLGLRVVYVTLRPNAPIRDYVLVQALALGAALAVTGVVAGAGGVLVGAGFAVTLLMVGVSKSADMFAETLTGPLQFTERMSRIFGAAVGTVVVTVGATTVVMLTTTDLSWSLAAMAAAGVGATFVFMYRPVRAVGTSTGLWSDGSATRRTVLRAGLPSGVLIAVISLVATMPQYFLTFWHGVEVAGHWLVLFYVYALADLATGAGVQVWIPTARRRLADGALRPELARTVTRWTGVYLPGTAVGLLLATWLLPLMFGGTYTLGLAQAVPLGLAIAALPFAYFSQAAVSVLNRYGHGLTLSVCSTAVAFALCAILVGPFGLTGAAWALAGAVLTRGGVATGVVLVSHSGARQPVTDLGAR